MPLTSGYALPDVIEGFLCSRALEGRATHAGHGQEHARPRTAWAGAVMLTVRPLHYPAAERTPRRAGVPDARPANKPQLITS
jgi:hypothetical protein